MIQKIATNSETETELVGERLVHELPTGSVVAFFGDLGMGKTAFVRGMCRGIGYTGEVTSPTFAIVHEYVGGKIPLYHFDMYRVSGPDDLYSCGYYDYLGTGILAIEWSENIEDALPDDTVRIRILRGKTDSQRIIEIERQEA